MEEIWRDIEGYVGIYMISNRGRVKSLNYNRTGKEQILKPAKDKDGYLIVCLSKNKNHKNFRVHTLVWDTFGSSPRNGHKLQVDHINNDKTDNRIENLQLLNCRANCSKAKFQKEKSSKYSGVHWKKDNNKWQAEITINKKKKYLGLFPTQEEAAEAYLKAKENL